MFVFAPRKDFGRPPFRIFDLRFLILDWRKGLLSLAQLLPKPAIALLWRGKPAVAGIWRGKRWTAANFEDLVHFVDEELEFLVGKVAVMVELFEFGGLGLGGGVAILLEGQEGLAHAGKGVEHAEIAGRVGLEGIFVRAGSKVVELLGELSDGELESNRRESGSIVLAGELEKMILSQAQLVAALASLEFVLITAMVPVGKVFEVKGDALLGQLAGNGFIGNAIVEEVVDQITLLFGEVSDFAVASWRQWFRDGWISGWLD